MTKAVFIFLLFIPGIIFKLLAQTDSFQEINIVLQNCLLVYLFALFSIKIASVVYPPLPGVVFTLASIPFIGWESAYIEAAIFLRILTGSVLSDGLAWGASLIGFRYIPFITGYGISHLITTLPVFYLVAASISFNSWVLLAGAAILACLILFKFKGRYFE